MGKLQRQKMGWLPRAAGREEWGMTADGCGVSFWMMTVLRLLEAAGCTSLFTTSFQYMHFKWVYGMWVAAP